MDQELYQKTLDTLCNDQKCAKYHELFKQLKFNDSKLVYGKYLYVFPPFPGMTCSDLDMATNIFSMTYNGLYNEKYNIDPYANDSCDSDSEECCEGCEK